MKDPPPNIEEHMTFAKLINTFTGFSITNLMSYFKNNYNNNYLNKEKFTGLGRKASVRSLLAVRQSRWLRSG